MSIFTYVKWTAFTCSGHSSSSTFLQCRIAAPRIRRHLYDPLTQWHYAKVGTRRLMIICVTRSWRSFLQVVKAFVSPDQHKVVVFCCILFTFLLPSWHVLHNRVYWLYEPPEDKVLWCKPIASSGIAIDMQHCSCNVSTAAAHSAGSLSFTLTFNLAGHYKPCPL